VSVDARALLRYLRQRRELGEVEWVLDSFSAAAAEALLDAALAGAAPATPGSRQGAASHRLQEVQPNVGGERAAARPDAGGPVVAPPSSTGTNDAAALAQLAQEASGCTRCRLCEGRRHVVFGEGAADAGVVVVGEAPGAEEDRTGRPFVGPAGKLLDLLLLSAGFPRARVYICNVLKCRPPRNRDPLADEVASCTPYLRRQIELIRPRVLLALGRFAGQVLLDSDESMGRLRGQVRPYRGVPVVATYHPAYLLRSPRAVRAAWDDFQLLRRVFNGQH
jgi:uracil-DNA glycosylase